MPVTTHKDSNGCYAIWSSHGHKYYYECGNEQARKRAEAKAEQQGRAARAAGYKGEEIKITGNNLKTNNMKKGELLKKIKELFAEKKPTEVQTYIFDKKKFKNKDAVHKWLKENNLSANKPVEETEDSFRMRQREPGDFIEKSFRTINIADGVQAVVGHIQS